MNNMEWSTIPEDVRSELDAEQRRTEPELSFKAPEEVPEDVLGEYDREAEVAREDTRQRSAEGRPPAEPER